MWGDKAFWRQRRDAPPGQGGPTASPNEGAGKGGDSSMDNKYLVLDGLTPLAASPPSRPYRTCSWEILHFAFSRGAV